MDGLSTEKRPADAAGGPVRGVSGKGESISFHGVWVCMPGQPAHHLVWFDHWPWGPNPLFDTMIEEANHLNDNDDVEGDDWLAYKAENGDINFRPTDNGVEFLVSDPLIDLAYPQYQDFPSDGAATPGELMVGAIVENYESQNDG